MPSCRLMVVWSTASVSITTSMTVQCCWPRDTRTLAAFVGFLAASPFLMKSTTTYTHTRAWSPAPPWQKPLRPTSSFCPTPFATMIARRLTIRYSHGPDIPRRLLLVAQPARGAWHLSLRSSIALECFTGASSPKSSRVRPFRSKSKRPGKKENQRHVQLCCRFNPLMRPHETGPQHGPLFARNPSPVCRRARCPGRESLLGYLPRQSKKAPPRVSRPAPSG